MRSPDGSFKTLGASLDPIGITSDGRIVGNIVDALGDSHGFILEGDGGFAQFDVPGASQTFLMRANDQGLLVGSFIDSAGQHGFLASPVPAPASLWLFACALGAAARVGRRRAFSSV